jgi:hypothetical protein
MHILPLFHVNNSLCILLMSSLISKLFYLEKMLLVVPPKGTT